MFGRIVAPVGLGTLVALAFASAGSAHSPYLAPDNFAPHRDFVVLTAAMTEGQYFIPDFPLPGEGGFWAIGPSGAKVDLGAGVKNREFTVIDAPLAETGTWRITTGDRAGRAQKFVKIDGKWRPVRGPRPEGGRGGPGGEAGRPGQPPASPGGNGPIEELAIPAGAETMETVSYLKSETFVSRGAPSKVLPKGSGQGFEFNPLNNPNAVYAGDAFKFTLTNDGKGAGNIEYRVWKAGDAYADTRFNLVGHTDAAGAAQMKFDKPGVYVLETRFPADAGPAPKSTTYTVSFEVTQ